MKGGRPRKIKGFKGTPYNIVKKKKLKKIAVKKIL